MVIRGHHFSFIVRNLEKSRHFYGDILGLKEIERPDFPFPGAPDKNIPAPEFTAGPNKSKRSSDTEMSATAASRSWRRGASALIDWASTEIT